MRRVREAARLRRAEKFHARSRSSDSPVAAAELMERAIGAHPGRAPVAWLRQAPGLHRAAKSDSGVLRESYERALIRSPHHGPLAKAYANWLRQQEGDAANDHLLGLLERAGRPLPAVLLQILGGRDDDEVRPRVESWLAAWQETPAAQALARVWQAWSAFEEPAKDDVGVVADLPAAAVRLFFIGRPPQRVTLDEAIAENATGSVEALSWFAEDFLTPDNPTDWPPRDWPSEAARARHEDIREPRFGFQTRLIRNGRLVLRDPGTGREVAPFDSTIVVSRVVYSFGDERLFVLLTGGYAGMASFVYDVQRHQLIDLGAELPWHMTVERVGTMLALLMQRAMITHRDAHTAAVARRHDLSRRAIVMHVNVVENPAHHLSNTFPGIERVIDHGLAPSVSEILIARRSEFYGEFAEIFPEFASVPMIESEPTGELDPHPYSPDHVIVMPGGYFIRRPLLQRLFAALDAKPVDPAAVLPPEPGAAFPVVWLGIRVGLRSWVQQEAGLLVVINRIREQWPDAIFVIDGFSRPMGRDLVSDTWAQPIAEMSDLAERIRRAAEPATVINLVGDRLRENVQWARAVDVYLTPSGSSQHKVGWLSPAPGLIYGPPKIAILPPERRTGSTESEISTIPSALIGQIVSRGELWSENDARTNTENVDLDPNEVADALIRLIHTLPGSR